MITEIFRYFVRKNFSVSFEKVSNEDIDKIGIQFHKYLDDKLNEKQKSILPTNIADILINSEHPLKQNGFDPAYVCHFIQWIEQESKKENQAEY